MFYPDKVRAHQEARRVLRSNGRYLLVTFDRLELNPVPNAAGNAVAALFPDDPPRVHGTWPIQLCRHGAD
jgi:hypothetical protein